MSNNYTVRRRLIIGLTGFKQSGKSTVAQMLMDQISLTDFPTIFIKGFADEVKQEVAKLLGTTMLDLEAKKNHPLIRHIFQWYGTEYARKTLGEDVWVKKMQEFVDKFKDTKGNVLFIIPDVRFPNEAEWIRQQEGVLLRVERKDHHPVDEHESESYVFKIRAEFIVNNSDGLLRLRHEVRCIKTLVWEQLKLK